MNTHVERGPTGITALDVDRILVGQMTSEWGTFTKNSGILLWKKPQIFESTGGLRRHVDVDLYVILPLAFSGPGPKNWTISTKKNSNMSLDNW